MNWLVLLLCLIAHAVRVPIQLGRAALPFINRPGFQLWRNLGAPPVLTSSINGTGQISGFVQGASDTFINIANRNASIRTDFRHDFAISVDDLIAGSAHTVRARVAVSGIFKHKVTEFSSGGAVIAPWTQIPTNARSRARIFTSVQIFEMGGGQISSQTFSHSDNSFGEDSSDGPVNGNLQLLVPVIETVNLDVPIARGFVPSGNNHILVRVTVTVRADTRGVTAEAEIAGAAAGTGWNDGVTGSMSVTLDNVEFQLDVDPNGACAEVFGG